MNAPQPQPRCQPCGKAAMNLFPLCGQPPCIDCLVAAALRPANPENPNICLCPEPAQAAACPGRNPAEVLPQEPCYACGKTYPLSAIASGELESIGASFLCPPCGAEMVRKDLLRQAQEQAAAALAAAV